MEHTISIVLTDAEEEQLAALTELYQQYEREISGKVKSSKENVLNFLVWFGLSSHLQENFNYLTVNVKNQLERGSAA